MTVAPEPPRGVRVRVPAKLNLSLAVGPRRRDGYHELATVFHAVSLYDYVSVRPADRTEVQVSGPYARQVPTDRTNLVVRAVEKLGELSEAPRDVSIRIEKNIPVAAGLAGGSADAAATLLACDTLFQYGIRPDRLDQIAAMLGSDVAFALHGGTAIGTGRGERLAPVLARGELHWVLAISEDGLSTPDVYAEFDRLEPDPDAPEVGPDLLQALRRMDAAKVAEALSNDLQDAAVALMPGLEQVLEAGEELGALAGVVSGSGPTVAFLVADAASAIDLSLGLAAQGVVADVQRVSGPVAGATTVPWR